MSINLKIKNLKGFNKKLNDRLMKNKVKEYVTRGTLMVQNTAKESIMKGGTGETVQRYEPRRTHTVSKPLNPPANDTGFLVSQITMNVKPQPNGSVIGQIISSAPYSAALEFGTTKMTERPFMQPALEQNKRKIVDMFVKKGLTK